MATITIPRQYFDTLLRRSAEVQTLVDPGKNSATQTSPKISIPKEDYEALLQSSLEYESLRTALISGGVTSETLDVNNHFGRHPHGATDSIQLLVRGRPQDLYIVEGPSEKGAEWRVSEKRTSSETQPEWSVEADIFVPRTKHRPSVDIDGSPHRSHYNSGPLSRDTPSYEFEQSSARFEDSAGGDFELVQKQRNHAGQSLRQRSLVMKVLPHQATLSDIIKAIQGGPLLNVFVRCRERTALISFVYPNDAEAFRAYSKNASVLVLGKRVEIFYDDREFVLPNMIRHNISRGGATRNLVIYGAKADMTDETIRQDLEHINNLEVVYIRLVDKNAYISLNSVHGALFARTCMRSRYKYKGCRIDFYADECNKPLPEVPSKPYRRPDPPSEKATGGGSNRFELLADDEWHDSL